MGKKDTKRKRGDEKRWEEIARLTDDLQAKLEEKPQKTVAVTSTSKPVAPVGGVVDLTGTVRALGKACNKLLLLRIADVVTSIVEPGNTVDTCLAALDACMKGLRVDEGEEGGEEGDGLEAVSVEWRRLKIAYARKKKSKKKGPTKRARGPNEVVGRLEAADSLYFVLWTWARDAGFGREEAEVVGGSIDDSAGWTQIPGPAAYFRALENALYRDTLLAADLRERLVNTPLSCDQSLAMLETVWGLRREWIEETSNVCPWHSAACNPLLAFFRARW
jgi:hypothetical protein